MRAVVIPEIDCQTPINWASIEKVRILLVPRRFSRVPYFAFQDEVPSSGAGRFMRGGPYRIRKVSR